MTSAPSGAIAAGIYTRISLDPGNDRLGVQRQEADSRAECERRGWQPVVYEDDDVSAYRPGRRPAYQRLLHDVEAGAVQAVVAYNVDRLYRHPKDLEPLIDICERRHVPVVALTSGTLDLATADGRLVARLLGAAARHQVERSAERIRRKHEELAAAGKSAGGGRPFGFNADRRTLRAPYVHRWLDGVEVEVDEPALVAEAARRTLAGDSLRAVCRDWTERRIPTPRSAKAWHAKVLRQILVGARISGRREVQTYDGRRHGIGRDPVKAEWPAIITVEQSEKLRALFGSGQRVGPPHRQLLSGIARCGHCGHALRGRAAPGIAPMLACPSRPDGCARIRVQAELVTAAVEEALFAAIDAGALERVRRRAGTDGDQAAVGQLADVQAQLAELARLWARRQISRVEWDAAKVELDAEERGLRRRLEARDRRIGLTDLPDALPAGWAAAALPVKRAFLSLFIEAVVIHPGQRGRFSRDRIEIRWRV